MTRVLNSESLSISSTEDVVQVRQAVRKMAVALGFGVLDQTKIVTASSELARNTLDHGGGGAVQLETIENDTTEGVRKGMRKGVRLVFEDQGPGIPDVARALTDGYTSGNGMGLGLGGSKRLSHEFDIASAPGQGTRVSIVRWK
jgi:serine/threonine-protein kinase RsbT